MHVTKTDYLFLRPFTKLPNYHLLACKLGSDAAYPLTEKKLRVAVSHSILCYKDDRRLTYNFPGPLQRPINYFIATTHTEDCKTVFQDCNGD